MNPLAEPASCRRRHLSLRSLLSFSLLAFLVVGPASADGVPRCSTAGTGWCIARRFPGSIKSGELGFRFGEPLDVDGDGRADVAAGARFKLWHGNQQNGTAAVWSGATGKLVREWDGEWPDGLFGHWVMPIPDVSGDGLADLIIAAPHAQVGGARQGAGGAMHGTVVALSPKTGKELWRFSDVHSENLGWDLTLAGDENDDSRTDLFVGAPTEAAGRVFLVSGKDGTVLRTYTPPSDGGSFGWWVARVDDLDGDGRRDLAVGGPYATVDGARVGRAWVLSSATGKEIHHWDGSDPLGGFGGVVTGLGDLDGDGKGEIAVAAPATEDPARTLPGELWIYSGRTGKELQHWTGSHPGELYGRMIVDAGDLDGDGVGDVAVGAPAYRRDQADRTGRVELRSGKSGAVLAAFVGDEADCWYGWHIRRAPDPEKHGRPALLIGSLRCPVDGKVGVGLLDLYVLRDTKAHGTKTRGARRSAIK